MGPHNQALSGHKLVDSSNRSRAHRGAVPIVGDGIVRGEVIVDLIEGFLGLVAVLSFFLLALAALATRWRH